MASLASPSRMVRNVDGLIEAFFGGFNWWQKLLGFPLFLLSFFLFKFGMTWLEQYKVAQWKKQLEKDM